jgi:predicted DCC family thiol-disulfide oxidoreductase YuxK
MADTVLYDANCNICKTITETLLTWDGRRGRISALPIQSEEGAALLRDVPPQLWLESFHLVRDDGSVSRFIPRRVKALANERLSARLSGGASSPPGRA